MKSVFFVKIIVKNSSQIGMVGLETAFINRMRWIDILLQLVTGTLFFVFSLDSYANGFQLIDPLPCSLALAHHQSNEPLSLSPEDSAQKVVSRLLANGRLSQIELETGYTSHTNVFSPEGHFSKDPKIHKRTSHFAAAHWSQLQKDFSRNSNDIKMYMSEVRGIEKVAEVKSNIEQELNVSFQEIELIRQDRLHYLDNGNKYLALLAGAGLLTTYFGLSSGDINGVYPFLGLLAYYTWGAKQKLPIDKTFKLFLEKLSSDANLGDQVVVLSRIYYVTEELDDLSRQIRDSQSTEVARRAIGESSALGSMSRFQEADFVVSGESKRLRPILVDHAYYYDHSAQEPVWLFAYRSFPYGHDLSPPSHPRKPEYLPLGSRVGNLGRGVPLPAQ